MAQAGRRKGVPRTSGPAPHSEALAALQLWQTFEYLSPQTPPSPNVNQDVCIWPLEPHALGDHQMPWIAPEKINALNKLFKHKRRFMLFAGVIDGLELVETTRELLDAPPLDLSEQRAPANVASFVIPVDQYGYVSGEVFVSTVPWAIACIAAAKGEAGLFNFSGFFGEEGVQKRVKRAVAELLQVRQLIGSETPEDKELPAALAPGSDAVMPDAVASVPAVAVNLPADDTGPVARPKLRTLDADDVRAIGEVVFATCGWKPKKTPLWTIETRRAPKKEQDKTPDDPLNSFFAEELEKIQAEYVAGNGGATLGRYLEGPIHPDRCNLEVSRQPLVDGVHPQLTPHACWPSKHPLVTAQQFAVNAIFRDLRDGGLFAVNGPPGTGKTTMLKDLLAGIVTERADRLVTFVNPLKALPKRLQVDGHTYPVWELDGRLRGFGIVVACANNGAAENISEDLPGFGAKDAAMTLDYFSEVADSLGLDKDAEERPGKRWGLVSAALGRQDKKSAFARDFWKGRHDDETDSEAKAQSGQQKVQAPPNPLRPFTLQDWFDEFHSAAPTWDQARETYRQAKASAVAVLQRTGELVDKLSEYEELAPRLDQLRMRQGELIRVLSDLADQQSDAGSDASAAAARLDRAKAVAASLQLLEQRRACVQHALGAVTDLRRRQPELSIADLQDAVTRAEQGRVRVNQDLEAHDRNKPGLISALLRRERTQQWVVRRDRLVQELDTQRQRLALLEEAHGAAVRWQRELVSAEALLHEAERHQAVAVSAAQALDVDRSLLLDGALAQLRATEDAYKTAIDRVQDLKRQATKASAESRNVANEITVKSAVFSKNAAALNAAGLLDPKRVGWHLFNASREEFHSAAPYQDYPGLFQARRELFAAALDLHKAFVVHAWKRLKPTLYASVGLLEGRINPSQVAAGPMALWDALFLVVPLLSTTFASFPRVFRGIGKEELAWVLIDEAGQAAPQYCVGALWRARRAVVVGDPLQLEPVVGIPVELTAPLRERCGTLTRYVPPEASAQTMADRCNRFGMYLKEDDPEQRQWLGAPLIVHRRCLNPMFAISNAIAYEGKMVYGAGTDQSGHAVPRSQWLDATTEANMGHWIPGQAQRALTAVEKLVGDQVRDADGKLRAFVITPFRDVAQRMRALLEEKFGREDADKMCGTVHTFQGREADYVVLLLGGDPQKPGVISHFAGRSPNLINVAVTRAKRRLYVLGNVSYWTGTGDSNGYFRRMFEALQHHGDAVKNERRTASG